MGCHTWVYKKVKALTEEEKYVLVDKEIKSLQMWWGFKHSTDKVIREVEEWFANDEQGLFVEETRSPVQYALDMIKKYYDKLNDYQENGFDAFIRHKQKDVGATLIKYNNELYVNIGFDTPCRVYGYPEDKFTDIDELIDWLKNTDNIIGYYVNNSCEFIEGFTDELENEVRNYFKKHGEENLLIEFG